MSKDTACVLDIGVAEGLALLSLPDGIKGYSDQFCPRILMNSRGSQIGVWKTGNLNPTQVFPSAPD